MREAIWTDLWGSIGYDARPSPSSKGFSSRTRIMHKQGGKWTKSVGSGQISLDARPSPPVLVSFRPPADQPPTAAYPSDRHLTPSKREGCPPTAGSIQAKGKAESKRYRYVQGSHGGAQKVMGGSKSYYRPRQLRRSWYKSYVQSSSLVATWNILTLS